MNQWQDFNNADDPVGFAPIPKGTALKVRMHIRPGGFDDLAQGWDGGWATQNPDSGAVYLNCEFVVLDGQYAKRKLWSNIGLHSNKGPEWAQMGRAFIKGMLNSAYGLYPNDNTEAAQSKRIIRGLGDLEGIVFVGLVDWEKGTQGDDKAVIGLPITPDHPKYAATAGTPTPPHVAPAAAASRPAAPAAPTAPRSGALPPRPDWA